MTSRELQVLRGRLNVLVAMREELGAIGASSDRRAKNRRDIADVLARLAHVGAPGGDLADATRTVES